MEKKWTIYLIKENGVVTYVGKTNDFRRRVYEHRGKRGTGNSAIPIYVDLNNVTFVPIETYNTEADALRMEDELICEYDTINNGWNRCRSGLVYSSDTKAYMREREKTDKRKAYKHEYQKTEKQRTYKREYRETEKSKTYHREYMRQYRLRKKQERGCK